MNDKKLVIVGIVLAVVIVGGMYFVNQDKGDDNSGPEAERPDVRPDEEVPNYLDGLEEALLDPNNYQDPYMGSADAPVTIVEYYSYGCGHCKNFHNDTLPILKEKYMDSGQVKYVARQFFGIAELPQAALCAAEQGKFWQYHDYLFEHGIEIDSESKLSKLKDFAAILGLEQAAFDSCYDSGRYVDEVAQWETDGKALGLSSVPAFYIGDTKLVGNSPLSSFESAIEKELGK